MSVVDEVTALFERRGSGAYFGEPVSMSEHSLQAAHFASKDGAPSWLCVAALLHDVGHLVVDVPERIEDWTSDARHEDTGAEWLAMRFDRRIAQVVLLHVAAKRYLCAVNPRYFSRLSPASAHTLSLQGGPMSADEVRKFESQPQFREAIRVRLWDDLGKVAGLSTQPLAHYRPMIEEFALGRQ